MSELSNLGGTAPIEDKYKGQSTADLLADDAEPIVPKAEPKKEAEKPIDEGSDDEGVVDEEPKEDLLAPEKPEKDKKEKAKEGEEEEEEVIEEEPDKTNEPVYPVPRKVILAKYPNLFKDFPFLERATQRDRQFTEVFATPEDAREAVDSVNKLNNINEAIYTGETGELLQELRKTDQQAFNRLVDNYLPALGKADPAAYYHVVSNISKALISDLFNKGKELQNEEVQAAAVILHKHLFGANQWTPPQKLAQEQPKPDENIVRQQQELLNGQYQQALTGMVSSVERKLTSTVDINIDPDGKLTPYEKKQATREVISDIYKQIEHDTYFRGYYEKLWLKAANEGFSRENMEIIEKNYLARAKALLRDSMTRVRNQVLKDKGQAPKERDRRGPIPAGRTAKAGGTSRPVSATEKAKEIPKGMSSLDYLMSDD